MRLAHVVVSAAIGALGVVAAAGLGASSAAAAPTGTSATETIGRLQAEGNNVVVNKVGTGPIEKCSVTSVRSVERKAPPASNPLASFPIVQRPNTVHVGLTC